MENTFLVSLLLVLISKSAATCTSNVTKQINGSVFKYHLNENIFDSHIELHNEIPEILNEFTEVQKYFERNSALRFIPADKPDADYSFSFKQISCDYLINLDTVIINIDKNSRASIFEVMIKILSLPEHSTRISEEPKPLRTDSDEIQNLSKNQLTELQTKFGKPLFLQRIELAFQTFYDNNTLLAWGCLISLTILMLGIAFLVYRKHRGDEDSNFFRGVRRKFSSKKRNEAPEVKNLVATKNV